MRRKRLQHHVDMFCHMFRGWQLLNDYRTLTELGSGRLEIDFLRETFEHSGRSIPQLSIAQAVGAWWRDDLAANRIPLDDVHDARLTADLELAEQEGQRDHAVTWAKPAPIFISCELRAHSILRTDEATYTSEYADRLEWPRNWAA
jgi:hypothetical protein